MTMSRSATRSGSSTPVAGGGPGAEPARVGPLGRLGRASFRHRRLVALAWVVTLVAAGVLSAGFSGTFKADYSAPGSDSHRAQDLLDQRFPAQSGDIVDVVVRAPAGVRSRSARADVRALLTELGSVSHVAGVENPYSTPGSVSRDGRSLVAHIRLDVVNPSDVPVPVSQHMLDLAGQAQRPGLQVALGGQTIEQAEQGAIGSEGIGLTAAAIILLFTFGSVVAAGLPILVAVAGLAVSSLLTGLVINVVDAPDWSTSLATMMCIGIGIDYVLLMVTRFREWRAVGLSPEAATTATLDTAGRSVMVAGSTVVVSMLGLFAMGLSFMRGAAVVTILSVLVVMAASVTLFPALLGFLGRHVDRLRLPVGRRRTVAVAVGGHVEPSRAWLGWSRLVERHRIVAALTGLALLLLLASPFLGVRFGFPDAGNDRETTSSRHAYDWLSEGFGAGANGPLLLVSQLPARGDTSVLDELRTTLASVPGVAAVEPPRLNPAKDTAVMSVIPTTGPQDPRTSALVHRLRDTTIPAATEGSGSTVHVGGVTAASLDSTHNIARRIPLLIGGVVALSMLLLLVSFRSVMVAVKAAVMNLFSVAASYGVVALVLQGGWAGRLVGIDTETPLPAFVPVLMFAVLFGLSMDYEVFLVSRMREAWLRSNDNGRAIVEGLASTGRVITAAAAIMIAVFAAFIPSQDVVLKVIGVGMASAIFIDATVVRMLLVPAVMHLLGRANWWLPAWMDRGLPQLHIEGRPEIHLPAPRPAEPATART
ncbi:MAG: putative drug exporter of the superfamily [Actinomycetota bacterium]|jgi:RND superfamily putative drug exporter|nr:putative drug exporter of the superfamily [Actinomycetota bacterium]